MRTLILLILVTGILAAAILSVQNATGVSLSFFIWRSIQLPVGVMLALCFSAGVALSWLLSAGAKG
jgi:uncharacterized integral membrane protein